MMDYKIDEKYISDFIDAALDEDVKTGDITALACIPIQKRDRAVLKVKADGVLAGMAFAERVFKKLDPNCQIKFFKKDGDDIKFGDIAFEVESQTQALLKAERLVLNTMQRMSGIATMSRRFLKEVEGLDVKILDTRKTTPLFRYFEKWAVKIGGCENYRIGLYDWFMIKDNHNDAAGGIKPAIERVEQFRKENNLIGENHVGLTVEVRNLEELQIVLENGGNGKVTRIMLDNFTLPLTRKAVKIVGKRFEVEASGGVTLKTVRKIAETGVDFISAGALTHSALSLDLSLKVIK
jgi:nicotinate-nucleotide pyrophosphorylase (carboxylating)